ncbi:hypothetical protein BR93DRAFT_965723 [Coniochaeta sp. PMI_546]|nr:hypothetical protein BR93DRAFT_965723 [Coniochaeta sp. PMI_546]
MNSRIIAVLALVSSVAAWGSVEFCVNNPDDNPGYNCATYTFWNEGCFDLPQTDGSWHHPNLRGRTHYVAPSHGLFCNVYLHTGCHGLAVSVTVDTQEHFDQAFSSITCFTLDN